MATKVNLQFCVLSTLCDALKAIYISLLITIVFINITFVVTTETSAVNTSNDEYYLIVRPSPIKDVIYVTSKSNLVTCSASQETDYSKLKWIKDGKILQTDEHININDD